MISIDEVDQYPHFSTVDPGDGLLKNVHRSSWILDLEIKVYFNEDHALNKLFLSKHIINFVLTS